MSYESRKTIVQIKYKKRYYEGIFEKVDKSTTRMRLKNFGAKSYLVSQNLFWAASGSNVKYMVDKITKG